jgi:hypothetical protein
VRTTTGRTFQKRQSEVNRAARLHLSPAFDERRIPVLLVRDLFVAVQLTEARPTAHARLEDALGPELAERLVMALAGRYRRAAA